MSGPSIAWRSCPPGCGSTKHWRLVAPAGPPPARSQSMVPSPPAPAACHPDWPFHWRAADDRQQEMDTLLRMQTVGCPTKQYDASSATSLIMQSWRGNGRAAGETGICRISDLGSQCMRNFGPRRLEPACREALRTAAVVCMQLHCVPHTVPHKVPHIVRQTSEPARLAELLLAEDVAFGALGGASVVHFRSRAFGSAARKSGICTAAWQFRGARGILQSIKRAGNFSCVFLCIYCSACRRRCQNLLAHAGIPLNGLRKRQRCGSVNRTC